MQLKELNIGLIPSYRSDAGNYEGKIKFVGETGEIVINIDHKFSQEILAVAAESLARSSKELAERMTAEVFTQNLLENKS